MAAPPSCTDREPTVSPPERTSVGVAVDHLDLVDRHAGAVGHEHRPRGLVALAVGRGAAAHPQPAAVEQLDRAELGAGCAGGDLDVHRDADAERHRVAGGAAAGLLGPELVVAGGRASARSSASG